MSAQQSSLDGWPRMREVDISFRGPVEVRDVQLGIEPAYEFGPPGNPCFVVPVDAVLRKDAPSGHVVLISGLQVVDHADYWEIRLRDNLFAVLLKQDAQLGAKYLDFDW